jgi:uncharacterized Rmd1/YagE family protein
MLAHYEFRIAAAFDRIEPLAAALRKKGRTGARSRELLHHIGNVLEMQHKMVGRVETGEKPELLWEHPELERLYMRLADEYELRERDRALDRKLDVISRTVETLLGLVQTRSSGIRLDHQLRLVLLREWQRFGHERTDRSKETVRLVSRCRKQNRHAITE